MCNFKEMKMNFCICGAYLVDGEVVRVTALHYSLAAPTAPSCVSGPATIPGSGSTAVGLPRVAPFTKFFLVPGFGTSSQSFRSVVLSVLLNESLASECVSYSSVRYLLSKFLLTGMVSVYWVFTNTESLSPEWVYSFCPLNLISHFGSLSTLTTGSEPEM